MKMFLVFFRDEIFETSLIISSDGTYHVSDYLGYETVWKTWSEVK